MIDRIPRSRDYALWALVGATLLGATLRILQFASGRSLWHDEALLALNVGDRSLGEVVGRLEFAQAAPWPFMLGEWTLGHLLGSSEASLRALPLVTGLASLVLFAMLARRVLGPVAAVPAAVSFAVADGFVYYTAEMKPYSSDVLVACVVLLFAVLLLDGPPTTSRTIFIGLIGGLAILSSYPSLFVVVPALATLIAPRAAMLRAAALLPIVGLWVVAATALAIDARARTAVVRDEFELDAQVFGSAPSAETATGDLINLHWLNVFGSGFLHTFGLAQDRPLSHIAKLFTLFALVGLVSFARRRIDYTALIVAPFAITLLASRLHLYPIAERTTLFLLPCVVLVVAEGLCWPLRRLGGRTGAAITVASVCVVLAFPVYSAAYHVVRPRTKEELRPVLETMLRRWHPGDTLVLHPKAQYAFRYYADCDCLGPSQARLRELFPFERVEGRSSSARAIEPLTSALVLGSDTTDPAIVRTDFAALHGRVWFLYSHASSTDELDFLDHVVPQTLDEIGTPLPAVRRAGVTAYLYEIA